MTPQKCPNNQVFITRNNNGFVPPASNHGVAYHNASNMLDQYCANVSLSSATCCDYRNSVNTVMSLLNHVTFDDVPVFVALQPLSVVV